MFLGRIIGLCLKDSPNSCFYHLHLGDLESFFVTSRTDTTTHLLVSDFASVFCSPYLTWWYTIANCSDHWKRLLCCWRSDCRRCHAWQAKSTLLQRLLECPCWCRFRLRMQRGWILCLVNGWQLWMGSWIHWKIWYHLCWLQDHEAHSKGLCKVFDQFFQKFDQMLTNERQCRMKSVSLYKVKR